MLMFGCSAPASTGASQIIDAIESIAPRVARIDLTIDRLNSECLQPLKNYDQNRLCASPLQLPTGTVLLIDESKLQPGQLNEKGLKNIKALKEVASRQIVPYDFKFYDIDMPVDLPVCGFLSSLFPLAPGIFFSLTSSSLSMFFYPRAGDRPEPIQVSDRMRHSPPL